MFSSHNGFFHFKLSGRQGICLVTLETSPSGQPRHNTGGWHGCSEVCLNAIVFTGLLTGFQNVQDGPVQPWKTCWTKCVTWEPNGNSILGLE